MKLHPRRAEAIELRKQGLSYKEIHQRTGISRSTLSYILRDIVLTEEQRTRLHTKLVENARRLNATISKERKQEIGRRSGKKAWAERREQLLANLARGKIRPQGTKRTKFSEYFPGLKTETTGGYRWVIVRGHPMADKRGRVLEHRYVMSQKLGRLLLASELVHHKDENKLNNHPDNLELLAGEAEHKRRHYPNAYVQVKCALCEKEFTRSRRRLHGKRVFCCRAHAAKFYTGSNRPSGAAKPGRKKREVEHGVYTKYKQGCRCAECRAANSKRTKEYRSNRQ